MTTLMFLHTRSLSHVARSIVLIALITLGSGEASAVRLAPVGHRQPTAADIPGIDPLVATRADGGQRMRAHRGDTGLDEGTLRICSNCDV
ncbi:MAG: hypothetical protein QOG66_1628 [Methylobacteriaceae bacterium]|jgi:hypothetical protein|nr:hypothetical protein [Methylobacteriaceae bacterium]